MKWVLLAIFYKWENCVREIHQFPKSPAGSSKGGLCAQAVCFHYSVGFNHTLGPPGDAKGGWPRRQTTARHQELKTVASLPKKLYSNTWHIMVTKDGVSNPWKTDLPILCPTNSSVIAGVLYRAGFSAGWRAVGRKALCRQANWESQRRLQEHEQRRAGYISFSKVTRQISHPSFCGNRWGKRGQGF